MRRIVALLSALAVMTLFAACEKTEHYFKEHETAQGAAIGTAAGAGLGAVAGEAASGDAAKGALIGGALGAAAGTAGGYAVEHNRKEERGHYH